jgi:hypothetical protein
MLTYKKRTSSPSLTKVVKQVQSTVATSLAAAPLTRVGAGSLGTSPTGFGSAQVPSTNRPPR